jgi:hypothetical protein
MIINAIRHSIRQLASLKLALLGLSGLFIIILWGTFSQIELGIFYTQKKYFQSISIFYEFGNGLTIPVFFGGLVWGTLLTVALIATVLTRLKFQVKNIGLILIHMGLIGLLIGSFLTGKLAQESQLIFSEGESKNYSINRQTPEVVISMPQPDNPAVETQPDHFDIRINALYRNSQIKRNAQINTQLQGIARHFDIIPHPLNRTSEGGNTISMIVSISEPNGHLVGQWGLSQGIESDQAVIFNGKTVYITLRDQRLYTPYRLSLVDFTHDVYPGTTVPKNFSSLVTIMHPGTGENRDVLIYMNHPLRYNGRTYFQASFAENDTVSILQVVKNPVWLFPYLSTLVITLGLLIQFILMFMRFNGRSKGRSKRKDNGKIPND